MLTVRFERLELHQGDRVLDVGAGFGRHAFEAARRGGDVVAVDFATAEVAATRATFVAMQDAREITEERCVGVLRGDATRLPFADASFDVVVTSEVLEHVQDDVTALHEMVRVLRPGGRFSCTAPSEWPEKLNWRLSDEYHAPKSVGGHLRIYSSTELRAKLRSAGLTVRGSHRAHALHSPYWWLRCAVGVRNEDHPLVAGYRRFLEWDIVRAPRAIRVADRVLNPLLGKSLVLYATKPVET